MSSRFARALLAVLLGNLLYFLVVAPALPPGSRHVPFRIDLALLIDFGVCVLVYGAIELAARRQ